MMIHPDFRVALARDRSAALMAAAGARRRAGQTKIKVRTMGTNDVASSRTPVRLRDGSAVLIRPVRKTDAPLLADGFARLSERSRWTRFLGRKSTLTDADLRFYTDVDHHDHEALGALDHVRGGGVGVARYVRDRDYPDAAEIAVTIVDDWQGRGLGTELVARLSDRARQEGIHRFTAVVAEGNTAAAGLLRSAGANLIHRGSGVAEYELELTGAPAAAS